MIIECSVKDSQSHTISANHYYRVGFNRSRAEHVFAPQILFVDTVIGVAIPISIFGKYGFAGLLVGAA
ncbi:MAG: hypothetical protein IT244_07360 [Bacteroidia bacterium]|nr:hypothetical protein [Bacteroidia bacterium]